MAIVQFTSPNAQFLQGKTPGNGAGQLLVLDAGGLVPAADLPANLTVKNQGSYTGDGTVDRAIAVGFAAQMVVVSSTRAGAGVALGVSFNTNAAGRMMQENGSSDNGAVYGGEYANRYAPGFSGNNFTVSKTTDAVPGLNDSGTSYNWMAFG